MQGDEELKLDLGDIAGKWFPGRGAMASNDQAFQTGGGGDIDGVYCRGDAALEGAVP